MEKRNPSKGTGPSMKLVICSRKLPSLEKVFGSGKVEQIRDFFKRGAEVTRRIEESNRNLGQETWLCKQSM